MVITLTITIAIILTITIAITLVLLSSLSWSCYHYFYHPSFHIHFQIKVRSVSHSMGLAVPGNVEQLPVLLCLAGQRQPSHNFWQQSSHIYIVPD